MKSCWCAGCVRIREQIARGLVSMLGARRTYRVVLGWEGSIGLERVVLRGDQNVLDLTWSSREKAALADIVRMRLWGWSRGSCASDRKAILFLTQSTNELQTRLAKIRTLTILQQVAANNTLRAYNDWYAHFTMSIWFCNTETGHKVHLG